MKHCASFRMILEFVLCALTIAPMARAADRFYLKDGDRVVFYGDSITDQRLYTTYIETYCLTRFPKMHLTFIHSGWSGDRVSGGGGGGVDLRLRRDVLVYKPTVVTICLGMNDGGYRAFDEGGFEEYIQGYRHILDTLRKELPDVRITLLTAPAYDDVTRAANFQGGYNATLVAYGEAIRELGKQYGLAVADTNAPLVAALARARAANADLSAHIINDRVHPGPGGHAIMAAAVLRAWHAPDMVANIEVDAATHQTFHEDNTHLSDVKSTPDAVTFTERDNALPWPLDRDPQTHPDMALVLAVTEITYDLNRYTLKVNGLAADRYTLKVDGKEIGTFTHDELTAGLDLATLPNLPANVQAQEVLQLTYRHNNLHYQRWRRVQVPNAKDGETVTADIQKQMDALDAQETEVLKQLRTAIQPKPHRVELIAVH